MKVLGCVKNESFIDRYSAHFHSEGEIVYNLEGDVTTIIYGKKYNISAADVIVLPPGAVHEGVSGSRFRDMFFQVDSFDFGGTAVVHDADGSIGTLINMIHKLHTEKELNYRHIEDNLAEAVCSYIKKLLEENYRYPFVSKLKNILYDNISNPDFDLAAEIGKTGFNKDYLRRCFKEDTGKTPLEYLTQLKINQAKVLLKQDSFVSIEDVAKKCGFTDSFYFSTCFKKHEGHSPMQYRQAFIKSKK